MIELKSGDIIAGKFKMTVNLGRGSLKEEIYKGRHLELDTDIIIRIMPPTVGFSEEKIKRFVQSIELIASLNHPNILRGFEAGEHQGRYYLVTASEKGFYLDEYLDLRGKLDEPESLRIVIDIASGLRHAWEEKKILHRNIKPKTILIARDDKPLITDFGMAKSFDDDSANLTMTGFVIGNPEFMSPEQIEDDPSLDYRSDMYCLGLVFYCMLIGESPFAGKNTQELMSAHLSDIPTPVLNRNKNVSATTSKIIDKMLAKNKNDRFDSWESLMKALKKRQQEILNPSSKKTSLDEKKEYADRQIKTIITQIQTNKKRKLVLFSIFMTFLLNAILAYYFWGDQIKELLGF